ncbi:AIM24 family protein [Oribacterium sp. oral taxon 102]|uniref:AIM24 family protein n=1 Tax=Oribacterium sp. oral taxon 102 TaxID=671214 RepID=UPI0015BB2972|nr:AIM24 family protein [Oribacterium sp. oral taxon 102]NWO20761.1 AIM24 family protein [Oribacterium sp. oral taxon 102]
MRYQIEGGSLPAAIIQLEPGETIVSELGGRAWAKGAVTTETKAPGGIGKSLGRMFSGENLFMSYYTAQGPAEIGFASSFAGSIIVRELQPGQSLICQKSAFLCATSQVELSVYFQKKLGAGLFGGEGFIMQKVTGPGLVFLELDGYVKEYDLQAGEELVCDTGLVALMDESCQMDVRVVKGLKNKLLGGEGLVDTVVIGPGKAYIQTMSLPRLGGVLSPFIKVDKK